MKTKLVTVGICLIYLILSIKSALNGGDFDVYLHASIKLSNGLNIYVPPFIDGLQYYYSPLFALMLIPFSSNFFITELFWLLISGFLFYRIGVLILKYLDLTVLSTKETYLLLIISSFFLVRFLLYNISMVQITIFLLWAIFESIHLINNNKWLPGSLLLALAINIKLLPLVILPYLVYRGKFKASVVTIICVFFYLLIPSLFIGYEFNSYLLAEWWKIINPLNSEHMIEAGRNPQSLVGVIPVFLTETTGEIAIDRNIFNLSVETTEKITNVLRLCFIAFTLYFLKSPFSKAVNKVSELRALAYIFLLVPLIFPHQQKYAFLFLAPMITYLVYYSLVMWKYNRSRSLKIYLFFLLIIAVQFSPIIGSDVLGRNLYDLIHHFRLLGIASILLIVFASIADPKKMEAGIAAYNKV